jgi:putative sterol carrier protein
MSSFPVSEDVTVDDFYKQTVPAQFAELTAGLDLSTMAGKEFTLQFNIEDKRYCLKISEGTNLEVVEGGVDKPMLCLSLSEADWRDAVTGKIEGILDRFTDPTQVADTTRYERLLATRGTLHLELEKQDGGTMPIDMIFNGEEQPSVTMRLALGDWAAMQRREVTGPALFTSGKMKAQGDMMFLMSLQALV